MNTDSNPIADLAGKLFQPSIHPAADHFDVNLWRDFCATGLDQVACTGEDSALLDAVATLKAAGSAGARIPVAEIIAARWLETKAGWDSGSDMVTVLSGDDSWDRVSWGRDAAAVLRIADGTLQRFDGPFDIVQTCANLAGEPRDRLAAPSAPQRTAPVEVTPAQLAGRLALFKAAMMVGAMDRILQICVEHAETRVQFDRKISQFQAVQQMLAILAGHSAAAGAAVQLAATDGSLMMAAIAKSRASEAVAIVTDAAHQVCGAMGYTVEFPLERLTKRLWSWREEAGNERYWNRRIGETFAAGDLPALWPVISSVAELAGLDDRIAMGIDA